MRKPHPCSSLSNAMSSRIVLYIVCCDLSTPPGGHTHWGSLRVRSASTNTSSKHRSCILALNVQKWSVWLLDLSFTDKQASKWCSFPFALAWLSCLKSQETGTGRWWNVNGWSRERSPGSALCESFPVHHTLHVFFQSFPKEFGCNLRNFHHQLLTVYYFLSVDKNTSHEEVPRSQRGERQLT